MKTNVKLFKNPLMKYILSFLFFLSAFVSGFSQAEASDQVALNDEAIFFLKLIAWLLGFALLIVLWIVAMLTAKDPSKLSLGGIWNHIAGGDALDPEMHHEYDGIRELDNPVPAWLKYGFYFTIGFGVVYLLWFHVFQVGDLSAAEYEAELADAKRKYGNVELPEDKIILVTDAAKLEAAKEVFIEKCVACHTETGGGNIGPNLTDNFWLNGGNIKDVYKTISEGGRPGKGMQAWNTELTSISRLELASYVLSLEYDPNGLKPEADAIEYKDGEPVGGSSPAPVDTSSAEVDSVATDTLIE